MQLEKKTARKLIVNQKTLAVAESCTGGLLTHRLTNISGSSAFLTAAVVSYADRAKVKLLKIPSAVIRTNGAVSAPVAKLMARNVQKLFDTDFGVGITGIAGPTGGTAQKPVGLVFIAVVSRKTLTLEQNHFKGSRLQIKTQAANRALELLLKIIGS